MAALPEAAVEIGPVRLVNPLEHPGWDAWLENVPERSIFHSSAWARVLHETYGHRPCYFCRFAGERLAAMLPVMEVASPLTGRRGVSLPFADFSPALEGQPGAAGELYPAAVEHGRVRRWKYLECRGSLEKWTGARPSVAFYGHAVELGPDAEAMFGRFGSAMRRGIRKAERDGIQIEFSASVEAMRAYYALHCGTRHRHGLPPQPWRFFEAIARLVFAPGHGFVATARFEGRTIAAAVFLGRGRQALYKFGASDYSQQHLRPNNLLMWEAMKRCSAMGFEILQFGRTSMANEGLRRFKLGFGAREETLEYARHDFRRQAFVSSPDRAEGWANSVFRLLPTPLLRLAGQILYPHAS